MPQRLLSSCESLLKSPRFAKVTVRITNDMTFYGRTSFCTSQDPHAVCFKPATQCCQIARVANFRLSSHSIVASHSNGNPAFTVRVVRYCACFQSCDWTYKIWSLGKFLSFDKRHVWMDLMWFWRQLRWFLFEGYLNKSWLHFLDSDCN